MDHLSGQTHFDDYLYPESFTAPQEPINWSSTFEEQLKGSTKMRDDPLDLENLQQIFTMPAAASHNIAASTFQLDEGLPAHLPLQQFTSEYFEDALQKSTPSLSTSLNSTPVSLTNATPSTKTSVTSLDNENMVLFPGVLATNPETSDLHEEPQHNSSFKTNDMFMPIQLEYTTSQPATNTFSVNSSPYSTSYSNAASPDVPKKSKSLSSSRSGSVSSTKSRNSLDSRLSLQRLGEVLQTSSLEETVNIEKYILKVFGEELKFPLGYKTWIRDTSESYREEVLNKLYDRVNPVYPRLTKTLLETVIRRATYSMMQGRLRKERRAASKANNGKN